MGGTQKGKNARQEDTDPSGHVSHALAAFSGLTGSRCDALHCFVHHTTHLCRTVKRNEREIERRSAVPDQWRHTASVSNALGSSAISVYSNAQLAAGPWPRESQTL